MDQEYDVNTIQEISKPNFLVWLSPVTFIAIDECERKYEKRNYLAKISIVRTGDGELYKVTDSKAEWKEYLYFLIKHGKQQGKKYDLVKGEMENGIQLYQWRPHL